MARKVAVQNKEESSSAKKPKSKATDTPKEKTPAKTRKPKAPKETKVEAKVEPEPESKVENVESKKKRSINMEPTLAEKSGLNISVARIKNVIANVALNGPEYTALKEIKKARPLTEKEKKKMKDNKHVPIPLKDLSKKTLDLLAYAEEENKKVRRDHYAKDYVANLKTTNKAKYDIYKETKKTARDTHDKKMKTIPEEDRTHFDEEKFNKEFDSKFYDKFEKTAVTETDEYKHALDVISKLKIRFSSDSKILLSTFIELLVKQLSCNGLHNCINDDKKIIKLKYALDFTKPEFEEKFPLYPLILNLNTYRNAVIDITESKSPKLPTIPTNIKNDYHFKFYIAEICRDVRMKLAEEEDANGNKQEFFNAASISREFKEFCSDLIIELMMRIGNILKTEVLNRGIKTINATIVKTVIKQIHIMAGIPWEKTFEFIREKSNKYNKYVLERRQKKKSKKSVPPAESVKSPAKKK